MKNSAGIKKLQEVQAPAKYGKRNEDLTQINASSRAMEVPKKPSKESYQEMLSFPDTGKISFIKNKNYKLLVSNG